MIEQGLFCTLTDGRPVHCFTITNRHGEYVTLLDYGATIHQVVVRDKAGRLGDVVLGADPAAFESSSYKGGTIGRCANRIAHGRCTIGGKEYQLEQNMRGHFLHGGSGNYAQKLFSGEVLPQENKVVFHWLDKGEGGFAGQVQADFAFSFDDEGKLTLRLAMCCTTPTVLNPTNHAYFNLASIGDVRDHWVWIGADRRAARDEEGLPNGGAVSVLGTPADFTVRRTLRQAMGDGACGYFKNGKAMYDEFYVFDRREMRLAAALGCPETGRLMKVYTDMPCLILFCSGTRVPERGKAGALYQGYCAVCLETGFVPNAVNCTGYVPPIFGAGEALVATTVYQFGLLP